MDTYHETIPSLVKTFEDHACRESVLWHGQRWVVIQILIACVLPCCPPSLPASQVEEYGAQPPIELLRQFMDHQGWYDRKELAFRKLQVRARAECLVFLAVDKE
jgi:hypothetical protein